MKKTLGILVIISMLVFCFSVQTFAVDSFWQDADYGSPSYGSYLDETNNIWNGAYVSNSSHWPLNNEDVMGNAIDQFYSQKYADVSECMVDYELNNGTPPIYEMRYTHEDLVAGCNNAGDQVFIFPSSSFADTSDWLSTDYLLSYNNYVTTFRNHYAAAIVSHEICHSFGTNWAQNLVTQAELDQWSNLRLGVDWNDANWMMRNETSTNQIKALLGGWKTRWPNDEYGYAWDKFWWKALNGDASAYDNSSEPSYIKGDIDHDGYWGQDDYDAIDDNISTLSNGPTSDSNFDDFWCSDVDCNGVLDTNDRDCLINGDKSFIGMKAKSLENYCDLFSVEEYHYQDVNFSSVPDGFHAHGSPSGTRTVSSNASWYTDGTTSCKLYTTGNTYLYVDKEDMDLSNCHTIRANLSHSGTGSGITMWLIYSDATYQPVDYVANGSKLVNYTMTETDKANAIGIRVMQYSSAGNIDTGYFDKVQFYFE